MSWRPGRLAALLAALAPLLPAGSAQAQTVRICAVQGAGSTPNMLGSRVTVTGVVTADYASTGLGGFFLQDPGCDLDPATSDGILVLGARTGLAVGNRVTVSGRVTNDGGMTAIEPDGLTDGGPFAGGVEAVRLSPPTDAGAAAAYLEAYEGMLVSLPASRVVAATDASGDAYLMPDSSAVTRLYRSDRDGRKLGLASPAAWLSLSHGDRVSDVSGPLMEASGEFKVLLRPGRSATLQRSGLAAPQAAPGAPGTLTLATYNLGGLFDAMDDPGKQDEASSPARYAVDLARRALSIGRYLGAPDVLGVQEVETVEVLQDLAAHPDLAPFAYRAALVEGVDPRGLDVGLLYRSDRLWLRSVEARPACSNIRPSNGPALPCDAGGTQGFLLFSRPPLLARLETLGGSPERLTVIVSDFESTSGEPAGETIRLAMADHVRALVDELKRAEPEVPVVVMGDLDDFEDGPALLRLTEGGRLANLWRSQGSERPYTTVSRGISQALDHILVDPSLVARVMEIGPLHVNVDFGHPGPDAPLDASHRASDHDPVRMTLRLR